MVGSTRGNGELYFGVADLYPGQGFETTKGLTIPEAEDQNTLVDDEETAQQAQSKVNPVTNRGMLITIAIFVFVIFLFSK
ncbi:hypothetical protein [Bacillus sp. WC2502]|uniref:hypothetical protein n=1 Tax=Bacillus sp. WC2502 TaxID=3461401 RepID=UPI004043D7FE